MKTRTIITSLSAVLAAAGVAQASNIPSPYEIGTWRGFRSAAVSYTFDDNSPNQFSIAQPMLDARGFKATFFCIVGNLTSAQWSTIQNCAAHGHEIGSHTLTHPDLTKLSESQVINEESDSKNLIQAHTGQNCVSLAYPYCTVPNESVTSQYYSFARSCNGSLVPSSPSDMLRIGAIGPDQNNMNTVSDNAANGGNWLVWLIHGLDNDAACCPISSSVLQSNINYVAGNPGKWWVDTFGNVSRYIEERNAAVLTVVSNGSSRKTLQLSDNLNNAVFNYPVTLRCPLPAGWQSATVTQNGASVPTRIVNGKVMFDVVPNGGNIVLEQRRQPDRERNVHDRGRPERQGRRRSRIFQDKRPTAGNLDHQRWR
jgi:oligosaccharide reducing-end xylanase